MTTTDVDMGAVARVNMTTHVWELIAGTAHEPVGIASVKGLANGWLRWCYTTPITRVVTSIIQPDDKYAGLFRAGFSTGLKYADAKIVDNSGAFVPWNDPSLWIEGSNFWVRIWGRLDS
jgi:5-hydroxyisourate hydrolase-like protein (transthyretin family)